MNGDGIDDVIVGAFAAEPDGSGNSSNGESYVIFSVASNIAPIAVDDAVTTDEDTPLLTGNVFDANAGEADSDVDSDSFTVSTVNGTADVGTEITLDSGALLTLNEDGSFDYDPNGQFAFDDLNEGETATDGFTYILTDGAAFSEEATVSVTMKVSLTH